MKSIFVALVLLGGAAFAQEAELIAVLRSEASLPEKADACRELARVGTRQAVPALGALLADERLSHRARAALEPIADPSVDAELRQALGRLEGSLLVGVIHSLGVRKDSRAVESLASLLGRSEPEVAQAAARALGSIGGAGLPALRAALPGASAATLPAVCEGLFRCAEGLPGGEAAGVYDRVRAVPNLPQHLRTAATIGAIRSRGAGGVALIVEALRGGGAVPASEAIRASMDLAGAEVTRALVEAVAQANEPDQILLLQVLGDRGDRTAAGALARFARDGSADRRVAAIRSLARLRDPSTVAVLAALARDSDSTVAGAALTGLAGLPGEEADAAVVALLNGTDTRTRIGAIGAVGLRRITSAIPALLQAAGDADAGVGGASFKVLGELGGMAEIPGVVRALLGTQAFDAGENALIAIGERQPDPTRCADLLLPELNVAKGEAKLALLGALGSLGGRKALEAMRAAAIDPDEAVRETAWRALCDWPTVDALPDLARMTRTATEPTLRSLALRGQLRLIPLQSKTPAELAAQVGELLPTLEQLEAQPLALSTLAGIHGPEALALVVPYLGRVGFTAEAGVAAVTIAEKIVARHPVEVASAMLGVLTNDEPLTKRVGQVLAQVSAIETEAGFVSLFNGRDLTGWEGKPGWWRVENGALTSESTREKPCEQANYLVWMGGEPADFELRAEFRLSAEGNSGIQLRSQTRPQWDTYGYQADMSGDGALVGFVYEHKRGLIAGRGERVTIGTDGMRQATKFAEPAELLAAYRKEAWNTYRIVCRGPEITLFVNGTLMCQFSDRDPAAAASGGIIALQMHPGPPMKIEFRNLRLKTL